MTVFILSLGICFLAPSLAFFVFAYIKLANEYSTEKKRYEEAEEFMSNIRNLENKIMSIQEAKIKQAIDAGYGPKTVEDLIDNWN